MNAKVSVVIPNYNRSGLVNDTVRNVLTQSLRPHEVIVVDDGSTDQSVESLHAEFGDQIKIISQENAGPGAARNRGLDLVSGEFVWLMDSDDLASTNKLRAQWQRLVSARADVVYGPCARVFFDGDKVMLDGPVLQQQATPPNRTVLEWFMTDWSLVLQQCLFRKSVIDRAGRYNTRLRNGEDGEFFVRILNCGARVAFEDSSLTLYRCDDFGKLTGNGAANTTRIAHWATALLMMIESCGKDTEIITHKQLQDRLWNSIRDLERHFPEDTELINSLNSCLRLSRKQLKIRSFWNRIRKAARTRLGGTHWTPAYQVGPLTAQQRHLISQLGFDIL